MDRVLAKSKAGHDKNHVYVVQSIQDEVALLVNGNTKKVESPKRKKLIHLQLIKHLPDEIKEVIDKDELTNQEVIDVLDLYNRRNENV